MGAEVKTFPGVTRSDQPRDLQPVAGVIEEIELLLADAKSGHLRAFAAATVRVGDYTGSVWVRPPNGEHGHTLAAAIGTLSHRYFADRASCAVPAESEPSA